MAWDLWSSSYDQVPVMQDGNYSERPGWHCDFYFGCGYDVIEEDALNEKSCIEVLRILIKKEDSELEELGKDFLSLQIELACAEHEKWPELCFSALSEKINRLDVSIRTLKNDHADDRESQPLLHNKPAETIHEIVKAFQRDYCQDARGQELLAKARVRGPSLRAISCAPGHSDGMKLSDATNLQVTGNKEDRSRQLVTKDTGQIPNSFLAEDQGNSTKEAKIVQEGNAIVQYDSTYAFRLAAGIKGGQKRVGSRLSDSQQSSGNDGNSNFDQKLCDGNEEDRTRQLVTKDTGQILNSFLAEDQGNDPKEAKIVQEGNAIVQYDSTYAFRLAAGIKGRRKCVGSRLSDSQQSSRNYGNSDLDQKLCDFALKSERRVCKKELVALAEDWDPMTMPLQVVYPQELCLANNELSSLKRENDKNSPQAMNNKNASHAKLRTKCIPYGGSLLTDGEKSQACGLKSATSTNLSKSDMSLPSKLKNQRKRKLELDAFSEGGPSDSPMGPSSTASTILTSKRLQKSRTSLSIDEGSLNRSLVRKITEREVQPSQNEAGEFAIVPYDSKFSELQKKRKVDVQTSVLLPNKLKDLKLVDLRAIAQQHKLRRYYKLSKGTLIEQLAERLSSN